MLKRHAVCLCSRTCSLSADHDTLKCALVMARLFWICYLCNEPWQEYYTLSCKACLLQVRMHSRSAVSRLDVLSYLCCEHIFTIVICSVNWKTTGNFDRRLCHTMYLWNGWNLMIFDLELINVFTVLAWRVNVADYIALVEQGTPVCLGGARQKMVVHISFMQIIHGLSKLCHCFWGCSKQNSIFTTFLEACISLLHAVSVQAYKLQAGILLFKQANDLKGNAVNAFMTEHSAAIVAWYENWCVVGTRMDQGKAAGPTMPHLQQQATT